jgi:MtN3 and saliva related transmembrane protein
MELVTWIGVGASIGTGISLLPQLLKIAKEKKANDISYGMLIVLFAGLVLWIVYGCMKSDWIIIVSNAVSLTINIAILYLNIKFSHEKETQARG